MPGLSHRRPSQEGFYPVTRWHTNPGVTDVLHLHGARRPVEHAAPGVVAKQSAGWFYCLMTLVKLEAVFVLEELPRCTPRSCFYCSGRREPLPHCFGVVQRRLGKGLG